MRLMRWLFPTRMRIKALEGHLGVFYDKGGWDEYEDRENGLLSRTWKRLHRLEKKVLTEKERRDHSYDD